MTKETFWNTFTMMIIFTSVLIALAWHQRDPANVNVEAVNKAAYQTCIDEASVPIEYQACDMLLEKFRGVE